MSAQSTDEEITVPASGSALELDLEKQEVRIPCRFVNPSRVIEVFACHRQGPTHETVVEFDVPGPELYQALLDLGCRPGSAWNITAPTDFLQTQDDRLLIEVRWKHKERSREYPAEGLLHDGEFGFPAFVRGFSFDAQKPVGDKANDRDGVPGVASRRAEIPEVVEVTLGGTGRQSPSYSLLSPERASRVGLAAHGAISRCGRGICDGGQSPRGRHLWDGVAWNRVEFGSKIAHPGSLSLNLGTCARSSRR